VDGARAKERGEAEGVAYNFEELGIKVHALDQVNLKIICVNLEHSTAP